MKEQNEYVGVFDYKESDTFRPTLKSRIHENSLVSKTLTCREDSCCVIERERERVDFEFANSLHENAFDLWDLMTTQWMCLLKINSRIVLSSTLLVTQ